MGSALATMEVVMKTRSLVRMDLRMVRRIRVRPRARARAGTRAKYATVESKLERPREGI
jgi:hypothetical protein